MLLLTLTLLVRFCLARINDDCAATPDDMSSWIQSRLRVGQEGILSTKNQTCVATKLNHTLNTTNRSCLGMQCPFGYVFDATNCTLNCHLAACCRRKQRASCTTMVCPVGFHLKATAKDLPCEWHLCASEIKKTQPDWIDMFDTCQCCDSNGTGLSYKDLNRSHFGFEEIRRKHCVDKAPNPHPSNNLAPTSYHCYGAGNTHWPPRNEVGDTIWAPFYKGYPSRSFGITNVKYSAGVAVNRPSTNQANAINCLDECYPTFWDNDDRRQEIRQKLLSNTAATSDCTTFDKVGLVSDFKWPNNLYHWVFDNILMTYLYIEEYSLHVGIDKSSIEIACLGGRPQSRFMDLWLGVLRRPVKHLDGCYKSVIYGGMWNQRLIHWADSTSYLLADPVFMTRMSAFAARQRAFYTPLMSSWYTTSFRHSQRCVLRGTQLVSRPEVMHSCRVIVAGHSRMPDFMKDYQWSSGNVGNGSCAIYRQMEEYTVKEQLFIAMQAEAMVGVGGAQFAWQVWMKATSPILVIHVPWPGKFPTCSDIPEIWHETTAIHGGRTSVTWKFCGGHAEFLQAEPVKLIRFTLDLAREAAASQKATTCVVLRQVQDAKQAQLSWPECNVKFSMPWSATRKSSCRWCSTYKLHDAKSLSNSTQMKFLFYSLA